MDMQVIGELIEHDLIQGSPEWIAFRLEHDGSSEASSMLGLSKKTTRTQLLHMKHTGMSKEFSAWVQENILDHGHEVEAMARPIVEKIVGRKLYPVVCSRGKLSVSCDGKTMAGDIVWEHKQWNEGLADAVRAGLLPDEHKPQCYQLLMITGAEKLIFTVSDGTSDKMVHLEVLPDDTWFDRILQGWAQFAVDLENYKPVEIAEKPKAEAILSLPALVVQIHGGVSNTNLPEFKKAAETFIASIKTDLQDDNDFANAEATVKFCKEAEASIEQAKKAALAQTSSIDELMRTVDFIQEQLRDKRLALDKLVSKRKDEIKSDIIAAGRNTFTEYVQGLDAEIAPIRLVYPAPNFIEATKNKRTLASLHDSVSTELSRATIEVNGIAKAVRENLAWHKQNEEFSFLFADLQTIIYKPQDDFKLVVTTRIDAHKKKLAEDEAARITQEATSATQNTHGENAPTQAKTTEDGGVAPLNSASVVPITNTDDVSAFLKTRNFGKEESKFRAVLVEFVRFQQSPQFKKAA